MLVFAVQGGAERGSADRFRAGDDGEVYEVAVAGARPSAVVVEHGGVLVGDMVDERVYEIWNGSQARDLDRLQWAYVFRFCCHVRFDDEIDLEPLELAFSKVSRR